MHDLTSVSIKESNSVKGDVSSNVICDVIPIIQMQNRAKIYPNSISKCKHYTHILESKRCLASLRKSSMTPTTEKR